MDVVKSSKITDFQVLNKLGEGSFSCVYQVKRISDGETYAMKKVKMYALNEKEKENALNEVRILASVESDYIICLKEAFFDESTNSLCLIMEIAENGDILSLIKKHTQQRKSISEQEIWNALIHMIKGLKTLHDSKILHRDLKCANVFISKDNIYKLGDMNVSKVNKNGLAKTQTGTPYYASPEIWSDKPYDGKCDIWSVGCIIYEMASTKPPFLANDMEGLYKKITKGVYPPLPKQYSAELSLIISQLLKVIQQIQSIRVL